MDAIINMENKKKSNKDKVDVLEKSYEELYKKFSKINSYAGLQHNYDLYKYFI